MPQPADEGRVQGIAIPGLGGEMDAEILSLLVPATLAVFLDPAMALIDTGMLSKDSPGGTALCFYVYETMTEC